MTQNGNFYAFVIGMMALCIGSFFMCYSIYKTQILPRFIAIWGFAGYAILLMGTVSTLLDVDLLTESFILGGLFEFFIPFWLFAKGFNQEAIAKLNEQSRQ